MQCVCVCVHGVNMLYVFDRLSCLHRFMKQLQHTVHALNNLPVELDTHLQAEGLIVVSGSQPMSGPPKRPPDKYEASQDN